VRLDRAVAWPIEIRGDRVDLPLEARFFAPDELEPVDAAPAPPLEVGSTPETVRALAVVRAVLTPPLAAAGFGLVEVVDDDEIGCLEYRAGPPTDPVALAITHVPAMSLIRAELWRPRRLAAVAAHGWHLHEETWLLVPDADPHGLACLVAATVGRWLDGLPAPS
jgi:hypothetical protein